MFVCGGPRVHIRVWVCVHVFVGYACACVYTFVGVHACVWVYLCVSVCTCLWGEYVSCECADMCLWGV